MCRDGRRCGDCNKGRGNCCNKCEAIMRYEGPDIDCVGVTTGDTYETVTGKLSDFICNNLSVDGEDGVGISDITYNPETDTMTINMTDGTSNLITGLKGPKGDPGDSGGIDIVAGENIIVTEETVGGITTYTISSTGGGDIFIERSLPDLHIDISNNELVPGATYKITGVDKARTIDIFTISALYDDGRDLGTTIFLKAISGNELETSGGGIFYNPKYNKQVQGFGIWDINKSYNVDDIVFWGGYAWKNLTGNTGTDADILNLNGDWEKLNYDDVNYNKVVDYIEYDIENNIITRRYDTVNEIDVSSGFSDIILMSAQLAIDFRSISSMQWGNGLYFDVSGWNIVGVGNISVKHTSFAELINFKGEFINNVTFDGSKLKDVTFDNGSYLYNITFDNGSSLQYATFDNSSLQYATFDKSILTNVTFDNGTILQYATFDNSSLQYATFDKSILTNVTFDNGSHLQNVTFDNGSDLQNVTFDRSNLTNVTFDNSRMRNNTFVIFGADFNNQTYNNLDFSRIKFEGNGTYTMPDLSLATIITDPNIPQKKVFGINSTTTKIQYWDSVSNDFVVADITD